MLFLDYCISVYLAFGGIFSVKNSKTFGKKTAADPYSVKS